MTVAGWLQFAMLIVALAISTPLLGSYMAKVYGGGRIGRPLVPGRGGGIYRLCRSRSGERQRWSTYALSLLAFSSTSVLVLYAQLRLQGQPADNLTA